MKCACFWQVIMTFIFHYQRMLSHFKKITRPFFLMYWWSLLSVLKYLLSSFSPGWLHCWLALWPLRPGYAIKFIRFWISRFIHTVTGLILLTFNKITPHFKKCTIHLKSRGVKTLIPWDTGTPLWKDGLWCPGWIDFLSFHSVRLYLVAG